MTPAATAPSSTRPILAPAAPAGLAVDEAEADAEAEAEVEVALKVTLLVALSGGEEGERKDCQLDRCWHADMSIGSWLGRAEWCTHAERGTSETVAVPVWPADLQVVAWTIQSERGRGGQRLTQPNSREQGGKTLDVRGWLRSP